MSNKKLQKILVELNTRVQNSKIHYPRTYLGMSDIGDECPRKVWMTWRWFRFPKFNGRLLRLFDRGHREEEAFAYYLRLSGIPILTIDPKTNRQFSYKDQEGYVEGHGDGIIPNLFGKQTSVEMKTHNNKQFTILKRSQSVHTAHHKHFCQLQRYMFASDSPQGLYMAVNKDNDDLYWELVEPDEFTVTMLLEREIEFVTATKGPQGISDDGSYWKCSYCDFKDICFMGDLPIKNCRTCKHICLPGKAKWVCSLDEKSKTTKFQLYGCKKHEYVLY